MVVRLVAVAYDAVDPSVVAAFWGGLLGRTPVVDDHGVLLPGTDTQVGLRFVAVEREPVGPHHLHLHLTSETREHQQDTVTAALALGGRHHDVGQSPDDHFVVLADPGGNELCVIDPGNRYLAGTGFLGEVACDGSREVGMFWSRALDWPLVWDQDGETAIQSPLGGTKVAWGGPPDGPKQGRNRQRFELTADDVEDEASRLVGLGATRLDQRDGGLELADPDGNELVLRPAAGRPGR